MFAMMPVFALLIVNHIFMNLRGDAVLLTVLQVYSASVIIASLLHLIPLMFLSLRKRMHHLALLILVVFAHSLIIALVHVQRTEAVFVLFVAPTLLLLCYHVIEYDAHADLVT